MCESAIASYADDPMFPDIGIDHVIKSHEDDSINLFKWFLGNQIKANSKKFSPYHQEVKGLV